MKLASLTAAVVLALTPVTGFAGETVNNTGNEFKDKCENPTDGMGLYCAGYVQATWNGMRLVLNEMELRACIPENVTIGQMKDVLLAYIVRNPEKRDQNIVPLMVGASGAAWPCPKAGG
jgi:hypothetical protein